MYINTVATYINNIFAHIENIKVFFSFFPFWMPSFNSWMVNIENIVHPFFHWFFKIRKKTPFRKLFDFFFSFGDAFHFNFVCCLICYLFGFSVSTFRCTLCDCASFVLCLKYYYYHFSFSFISFVCLLVGRWAPHTYMKKAFIPLKTHHFWSEWKNTWKYAWIPLFSQAQRTLCTLRHNFFFFFWS